MKKILTFVIIAGFLLGGYMMWSHKVSLEASEEPSVSKSVRSDISAKPSRFTGLIENTLRWEVRLDQLRNIKRDSLSEGDIDTLYQLLNHRPEIAKENDWWVIVNEIMEQLRLKNISTERLTPALVTICNDPTAPYVLRDYASQHLGHWLDPIGKNLGEPYESNSENVKLALETLTSLVTTHAEEENSLSGTSLGMLVTLNENLPQTQIQPALEILNPWIGRVISEKQPVSELTKISVINAVGGLSLDTYRPEIRALATGAETPPNLKLNSIAVLGQVGDSTDLPRLQLLAQSDSKFRFAAQSALNNLTSKNDN